MVRDLWNPFSINYFEKIENIYVKMIIKKWTMLVAILLNICVRLLLTKSGEKITINHPVNPLGISSWIKFVLVKEIIFVSRPHPPGMHVKQFLSQCTPKAKSSVLNYLLSEVSDFVVSKWNSVLIRSLDPCSSFSLPSPANYLAYEGPDLRKPSWITRARRRKNATPRRFQ